MNTTTNENRDLNEWAATIRSNRDPEGFPNPWLDWRMGDLLFTTYVRCYPEYRLDELLYIDVCAISVKKDMGRGKEFSIMDIDRAVCNQYIGNIENLARRLGRELRFTEFSSREEIDYFISRGYETRSRLYTKTKDPFWVEAFKQF